MSYMNFLELQCRALPKVDSSSSSSVLSQMMKLVLMSSGEVFASRVKFYPSPNQIMGWSIQNALTLTISAKVTLSHCIEQIY
jgi:hypothetical protein